MDFSCKKFNIDEVIKCSLGLTKSDFKILKFLLKNSSKKFDTSSLSNKFHLDKSTIQRSVKKLYAKKLVLRSQLNQSVGGYIFFYSIKDKSQLKKFVLDIIDHWVKTVEENMNGL